MAAAALLIIWIDRPDPRGLTLLAYSTLILFTLYSLVIYVLSTRQHPIVARKAVHWIDILWYLPLIAFTSGTNSVFFFFFLFTILVGAFDWGFKFGLRLTLASAVLFALVSFLSATSVPELEFNRLMLRTIQLLIFGYVVSRWGGLKIDLRNRLQLLKEVTVFSNPQFGIDRTIKAVLESLRGFYDADACLLVLPANDGEHYQLYRMVRGAIPTGAAPPEVDKGTAQIFLLPSTNAAIIYRKDDASHTLSFDIKTREVSEVDILTCDIVASMLETEGYLSIPVYYRHQSMGRLYIIGGTHKFDSSDLYFVLHLMDHVTPVIENIRLVDNLASEAAEQERRRIARDIHDSVIQPYLGLQFGIAALRQKLENGNTEILKDVRELLDLTNHELAELRRYVWGLRAGEERQDVLLPAIHRYASRFSSVTGINVKVESKGKIEVNDRMAAEVFQIVTEGLSNVRRHAQCESAKVEIVCQNGRLHLKIKNSQPHAGRNLSFRSAHDNNEAFTPRSISERAALLGGATDVFVDENNYTVVSVGIPL